MFSKPLVGGERREFIPVDANSLRRENHPVATRFLVADEQGNRFLQGRFGGNARPIPAWLAWGQIGVAGLVVLMMASSLLFAFIWLPARVFGRFQDLSIQATLAPLLAVLALVGGVALPFLVNPDMIADFGNRTARSLTVFLGTLAFAGLSVFSGFATWRAWRTDGPGPARLHALLVSAACIVATGYLAAHGLIGLRTWAY